MLDLKLLRDEVADRFDSELSSIKSYSGKISSQCPSYTLQYNYLSDFVESNNQLLKSLLLISSQLRYKEPSLSILMRSSIEFTNRFLLLSAYPYFTKDDTYVKSYRKLLFYESARFDYLSEHSEGSNKISLSIKEFNTIFCKKHNLEKRVIKDLTIMWSAENVRKLVHSIYLETENTSSDFANSKLLYEFYSSSVHGGVLITDIVENKDEINEYKTSDLFLDQSVILTHMYLWLWSVLKDDNLKQKTKNFSKFINNFENTNF